MEFAVINQGTIFFPELNQKLIFRSMLNHPIGFGFIFLVEKTPELVELEMKMMSVNDRNAPVFWPGTGQPWPIFWEDDMPEIPMGYLNVYEMALEGKVEILEIEPQYNDNHLDLFHFFQSVYKKGYWNGEYFLNIPKR